MPTTSTAKDWDDARSAFSSSIMIDTSISGLAQNLDIPDWPIKGKDETPSKYIDLSFQEAQELLTLKGQPPELIDRLISIMQETMAFDSPFGEMVEQAAAATIRENPFLKNLSKLGISEDFPVKLTALSADTVEFCQVEKLLTLGQFAVFAQGMSQTVIVGGDFKRLLNSLANVDEAILAELLPYRKGTPGLHLIEALAQALKTPDPAERAGRAAAWFAEDAAELSRDIESGNLSRKLTVLGNPALEKQVAELLKSVLRPSSSPGSSKPGTGFFGRLAGLFRR